ncbi:hypothetical protein D3C76_1423390 [compost metagenome]
MQSGLDAFNDIDQQCIPDKMAPGVINTPEAVEIEKNKRKRAVVFICQAQTIQQHEVHLMAVRQSGEGVVARLDLQLVVQLAQVLGQLVGAVM